MKATGIVRRIDDLGRVVIPKEIRRTLRIREGDPLEIYTTAGGEVIFKKYSPMGEMVGLASDFCEAIAQITSLCVSICDRDHCIAAAGTCKKQLLEQPITSELEALVERRRLFEGGEAVPCVQDTNILVGAMCPIVSAGDITGCICLLQKDGQKPSDSDIKLIQMAASFLSGRTE